MKFKFLVVTFNIVLIVSFLIVFFTPFFALDAGFMAESGFATVPTSPPCSCC
jgi:hypothetical protein